MIFLGRLLLARRIQSGQSSTGSLPVIRPRPGQDQQLSLLVRTLDNWMAPDSSLHAIEKEPICARHTYPPGKRNFKEIWTRRQKALPLHNQTFATDLWRQLLTWLFVNTLAFRLFSPHRALPCSAPLLGGDGTRRLSRNA
jgi:hypothetical protein